MCAPFNLASEPLPENPSEPGPLIAPLIEARWEPEHSVLGGRARLRASAVVLERDQAPGSSAGRVNVTVPGNPTLKLANLGAGTLTPGQSVTVSFDWKGADANGGVVDVVLFSEVTGGGVSKTDAILGGGGFPANWTKVGPLNLTAGPDVSGGVTLQITAICGGVAGCVSDVFIDNVSIVIN